MNTKARKRIKRLLLTSGVFLLLCTAPLWAANRWNPYISQEAYYDPQKSAKIAELHDLPLLGPPTAADTAETIDVQFTPALTLLAGAFGPNPVDLYNFVHDSIEFDIYFGSLKGSEGCLQEGKGNDFDQASLLIALLRYHGIPARYQFGTLRLTLDQAQELSLTNIDLDEGGNPLAINQSLSSMGIPAIRILEYDGSSLWVDVDLCWVRAYVPSTNYRGNTGGDSSASDWIYLFPAFKKHEYLAPQVDIAGEVLFNQDDFFQNAAIDLLPIEYYRKKVYDYIEAHGLACPTLGSAMIERRIVQERLDVLPLHLPAPIVVGGQNNYQNPATWSEIPSGFRHQVEIKATYIDSIGWEWDDFSKTITLPETYGKKVAVEWSGSKNADQEAIEIAGGIDKVPKTAILFVTSRLVRDDQEVLATGDSLSKGTAMALYANQKIPNYAFDGLAQVGRRTTFIGQEEHEYDLSAGGAAALSMSPNSVPSSVWNTQVANLAKLKEEGASLSRIRTQELQIIGLDYLRQNKYGEDVISGIHQWNYNHYWYILEIADLLTEPDPIWGGGGSAAGTRVDFLAIVSPHPIHGDFALDFEVTNAAGHNGSGLEFEVLNKYVNQTSVAYVNLMQRAYQQNDGYVFIDSSNVDTFDSQLVDIPAHIISGIKGHVNQGGGNIARCPKRQITVNNWKGLGYYKGNGIKGTGAYLIYGGFQ